VCEENFKWNEEQIQYAPCHSQDMAHG